MHSIFYVRPKTGVPELCPLFKIMMYPYSYRAQASLILPQLLSHLNDCSWFALFPEIISFIECYVFQTPLHYAAASTHGGICLEILVSEGASTKLQVGIIYCSCVYGGVNAEGFYLLLYSIAVRPLSLF